MPRRTTAGRQWWGAPRTRYLPVVTTVAGLLLLLVAAASSLGAARAAAVDDLDQALTGQVTARVSAIEEYFDRAESINLLLANDTGMRQFAPRSRRSTNPQAAISADANQALKYLETLYPDSISEACLIDDSGTELARVVRGIVAPHEELSTAEAQSSFFAPTMQLPRDRVHQAEPYLSPDTGEWVISNSTPMVDDRGTTWGVVHFEVALDSFRAAALSSGDANASVAIVDNRTGRVILEEGRPLGRGSLGRPASPELAELLAIDGAGSATVDGSRVAVAQVVAARDNVNSWSVVVTAPLNGAGWFASLGPAEVAVTLAALALLTFAGLNMRAGNRELERASLTDELTGLPNRRLLTVRLAQALQSARTHRRCAVLLVDLDRFKEVNDTLGHHFGDRLLREAAVRLTEAVRPSDTVARLGGDEYALILPDVTDEAEAVALAARCLEALHRDFVIEGLTVNVEASIGLALAPDHGEDGTSVLRAADHAMYVAKERKSGVVVYESGRDARTPRRLALLGDLRRALKRGELVMHYQPKVDLDSGSVRSAEALVRWRHPERGLLAPAEFIPVAEGTGLILPLTMHTLELSIAQARRWYDGGHPIQIAVNLSPRCLLEADLPLAIQALLDRYSLPPGLLRLEITESTFMIDPVRALAILTRLQESGVALSLDDFGTGYSSMSYLKRLPVDELKIDRTFVTDMLSAGSDSVMVRSSIDLGHNLGLSVVAEGVEDIATMRQLAALGCDVVQGHHLAFPMPAEVLTSWLTLRRADSAVGLQGFQPTPAQPEEEPRRLERTGGAKRGRFGSGSLGDPTDGA